MSKRIKIDDGHIDPDQIVFTVQTYLCGDPDCRQEMRDTDRVEVPFAMAKKSRANSRIVKCLCPNCGKGWQLNQVLEGGQWMPVDAFLITDSRVLADLRARVCERQGARQIRPQSKVA